MARQWWMRNGESLSRKIRTARRARRGEWPGLAVELLEDRTLLSGGPTLPPPLPTSITDHLGSDLIPLAEQALGWTITTDQAASVGMNQSLMQFDSAGRVGVDITAGDVQALLPALQQLGFQVSVAMPQDNLVDGYLPTASLIPAAELYPQGLLGILASYKPMTSAVVDQGANVLEADRVAASTPGYNGAGVKVGALSDSFSNSGNGSYLADQVSGDLPGPSNTVGFTTPVTVLQEDPSTGTDEGRAMLQIVHHLAPGATLGFATADVSEAQFAQNILNLADPTKFGANVITDDVTYFDEPYFQDGIIAQAINTVATTDNVSYFSAAGNIDNQSYESTSVGFVSDTIGGISSSPANYYNFGGGTDRQSLTLSPGQGVLIGMEWDQPYYTTSGVTNSVSLYLLDHATGTLKASSTTNATVTQQPFQFVAYQNTGNTSESIDLVMQLAAGSAPGRVKWVNYGANEFGDVTINNFATNSSTIIGHPGAATAMAVAAAPFYDQRNPESFTSQGPVTILFSPTGTRLATPQVRAKPDITAPDGTSTSFFGGAQPGVPGFLFFGTSAAAPHAAAVAALYLQANPTATPTQVYTALQTTADPNIGGTPGNPNLVGAGLIDAYPAIFGNPVPAALNVSDGFESGVLGKDWQVYNAGSGRTQVVTDAANADHGTHYLALDSNLPGGFLTPALSEAVLHVNATGLSNVMLSFNQKQFGNEAGPAMPATFTGHSNSDGVAFSVDGVHWFLIVSLTGANSTTAYQAHSFNLSAIAAADHVPLGADVQIKFQRYYQFSGQVTSAGFAFDDVSVTAASAVTHFAISAPSSATAGAAFSITVTAEDASNNPVPGYTGTVHFTKTDGGAGSAVPADYTFVSGDNGVHTFTNGVTFVTAGNQTVTATDTVTSSITGSATVAVSAAAATHFTVSAPSSATAGTAFNFTVTALDPFNNTATGYGGTVHFTSTDGAAVLPANGTLTNGTGSFSATLKTAGNQTLTATDTVTSSITGTSGSIAVSAAAATHFTVSAPASATAGVAFNFTVTALDAFNNTATGYAGTAHFTSTDGQAVLPANSTLTNGTGTFSVTLKTAGNQTVTATDTVTSSIIGTSNTISVSAAAATHFTVSAPASATAGVAFNFTVTALDPFNNTATGYGGTVHFTSTDGAAVLPANGTLTNGTGSFSVTLKTAGNQTVTATDTVTSSITGTSGSIAVSAAAATHYTVSAPASATAGVAFSFTVTALDPFNNTATGYAGTAHFTSTDGAAVLPANSTLSNGTGSFSVTLKTAGNQTVTATDTVTSSITGTSNSIAIGAAAATHYTVSAPASATAGVAFNFTVTALDAFNNTATGYAGTAHFTSTDGQAVLPANSTLSNGTGTFSVTLKTAGSQTLTATDTASSSVTGTSGAITVSAAAAVHFTVSAPASATAGAAFSFTVTAQDQFNNTATGYAGMVHFTSTDGQAVLPANSTLSNGTGSFSATLKTAGNQTITATDTATISITGTSGSIAVSAAAATHFTVSAPASATAGSAFSFTVTALDQFNNTATGYAGTVHFTSSDGAANLPANSTLSNGTGSFSATLNTTGSQTITATDTVTSSITGTSNTIAVSANAATHFAVSAPSSATAGAAFSFTVTALDASNNTATGYTGTVHFTSSDGQAVLPANSTLTNGTGTFSVTLKTAGGQTVTATDTVTSSITGTSNAIAVSAAAATHFTVSAPASATAGAAFNFTVTALDPFNNTATGYGGTVHFTSSDGAAVLPANSTLSNGTGTFSVTLKTAGNQTLTATDTVTNSITGTSNTISVSAAAATHYTVSAPASATAGVAFNFTVTALDPFNNTATGYGGTVHFTSSDGAAVLPANSTLSNGTGTFSVTLKTAGNQTVTATDTVTSSITGTSGSIAVSAAAATHFAVSAPSGATAGSAFSITVTALDPFNNTATGYAGTVHFTKTDNGAGSAVPADYTFVGGDNGAHTFTNGVTFVTAGSQTVTATDTVTGSITGSATVTVIAGGGPFTYDWNGSVSTDWFNPANWTDASNAAHHAVPTAVDTVIITGGPNATVLNAPATVANLQIATGTLTLNANLTDLGSYFQDQGFVAFGSNLDWLIIDGDVSRFGGFLSANGQGTVVLDGTSVQTITDMSSPEHPMPNLNISNPAGVVLAAGSNLSVQGSGLSPGSALTLAGTATLNVIGSFVDLGTLNLSVPTPNNPTAPLTVGHRLTAGNTAVFNFAVGSPANGNVYRFVQFGTLTDNGATYNVTGNGLFSTQINKTPPFIAVTTFAAIYDWNGSVSTDWFTAANWTDVNDPNHHAVPTAVDTVIITGGPNATVLNAPATVANLQIATGTLTLNANLTDLGSYFQDQGFVAFGSNLDWLIIDGDVSRFGGFLSANGQGTVVLDGTSVQTITDMSSPEHPMPNLNISNPAGVVLAAGSNLSVQGSGLSPGSALTLAGTATLNVIGSFVDLGTLNLSVPTPNNPTAPLTVGHRLTAGNTAVFNFAVGSPANGNVYRFVQFGTLTDNGATYNVTGNGTFSPVLSETAPFIAVTTVFARYNWNGSVSSDWFNPANWTDAYNPNRHFVPGPTDTAVITGGPNATVLNANATVGNLQISNGFLILNANLTDSGTYYQDQGFVTFGADSDQLQIAGNVTRPGGIFFGAAGTVVLDGTAAQSVTDTSGHTFGWNLVIANTSAAGVTIQPGSNVSVGNNVTVNAGSALNLSVLTPGNATAPLSLGGTLTLGAGSQLNLAMGAPSSGAAYLFITYGAILDDGVVFGFSGQGGFTPTAHKNANSLTVTLA